MSFVSVLVPVVAAFGTMGCDATLGAIRAAVAVQPVVVAVVPAPDPNSPPAAVAVDPNAAAPAAPTEESYADDDPTALTDFHAALDPAGTWADDPTYGTVWTPNPAVVGADFAPYSTAGHWVHDDDEWVWTSDYDWGWAPFHYGRWVTIDGRGWSWIPGRQYSGAWVSWGADDAFAFMGWAPAMPEFTWVNGVSVAWAGPAFDPVWAYVPNDAVFSVDLRSSFVHGDAAVAMRGRVHEYAAEGRFHGPPPAKLGYTAERVPHSSPAERARIDHARQYSHPSTARAMGGGTPRKAVVQSQPRGGAHQAAAKSGAPTAGAGPKGAAPPAKTQTPPKSSPAPKSGGGGGKHK